MQLRGLAQKIKELLAHSCERLIFPIFQREHEEGKRERERETSRYHPATKNEKTFAAAEIRDHVPTVRISRESKRCTKIWPAAAAANVNKGNVRRVQCCGVCRGKLLQVSRWAKNLPALCSLDGVGVGYRVSLETRRKCTIRWRVVALRLIFFATYLYIRRTAVSTIPRLYISVTTICVYASTRLSRRRACNYAAGA